MNIVITDFDLKGSGYYNIMAPLCTMMAERGHEMLVIGVSYKREQHNYPFNIVPLPDRNRVEIIKLMLEKIQSYKIKIDSLTVALDIPYHEMILSKAKPAFIPYIAIMPIESGPLNKSWKEVLDKADARLVISRFGQAVMKKAGLQADHLCVGIDRSFWKSPTSEERAKIRESFGIKPNEFFVLTVADNHDRKYLWGAAEMISGLAKERDNVRWALVSRLFFRNGWNIFDMVDALDIKERSLLYERNLKPSILWSLYAAADAFLITSKAEGLCIPILEAMSVGVPVVAHAKTAMKEHIAKGRGLEINSAARVRDPWGNSVRYIPDTQHGVSQLIKLMDMPTSDMKSMINLAQNYVNSRSWENAADTYEHWLTSLKSKGGKVSCRISP